MLLITWSVICFRRKLMASDAGRSAESKAFQLAFHYLVNSIDTNALLPAALSIDLITGRQRSECASEPDPYIKAEKFLGHLQRAVNGDSNKYHAFVQILHETGQASIASRLQGWLCNCLAIANMHLIYLTRAF